MNGPKVSVIIPFFNSRKYFKETIESVLSQTFTNWELLLVDDGSTDGSDEVAVDYSSQHRGKVFYLSHEGHQNRGPSPSRNLGFRNSHGEIVLFLDSDDILLAQKLENHLSILESQPEVEAVFGATLFWRSWSQSIEDQKKDFIWEPWKDQGIQGNSTLQPPQLLKLLIMYNVMPCPSSLMIRHSTIERIGGWPEDLSNIYDDHGLCVKLFKEAPVFIASGWHEKYRLHEDSWVHSTQREGKNLPSKIIYYKWVKDYLSTQQYQDDQIEQFLTKELSPYLNPFDHNKIDIPLSVGLKNFGELHRTTPISRRKGLDRSRSVRGEEGQPVDRYYIEAFLGEHSTDIQGRVLEMENSRYIKRFGRERVKRRDVLDVNRDNKKATFHFDLSKGGDDFPHGLFDCFILAQRLAYFYDIESAVKHAYATLKPGGILLATLPGISQITRTEMEESAAYWRFTVSSAQRLFGGIFGNGNIVVKTLGNVLAASALLFGLESQEIKKEELDFIDPEYQVVITVRAVKKKNKSSAIILIDKFKNIYGKAKRFLKRALIK